MKQSEVKGERYYCNKSGNQIRYVLNVPLVVKGSTRIYWVYWRAAQGYPEVYKEVIRQPLSRFAQWADHEVRPIFNSVVRCPHCDAWDWWADVGTEEVCHKCEKSYKPKA